MAWKTSLMSCREMPEGWGIGYVGRYRAKKKELVGTLAMGYGDGFLRLPGNEVLIRGKRVKIIGTECLDMCMVHLDETLPMGEEVVVVGRQGNEEITIEDLAKRWKMTFSSISSTIAPRVPRVAMQD
jgi:alanine racemase